MFVQQLGPDGELMERFERKEYRRVLRALDALGIQEPVSAFAACVLNKFPIRSALGARGAIVMTDRRLVMYAPGVDVNIINLVQIAHVQLDGRHLSVYEHSGKKVQVSLLGDRPFAQALVDRLTEFPAFNVAYDTPHGDVGFTYFPWRPGCVSSWRVWGPGTYSMDEDEAAAVVAQAREQVCDIIDGEDVPTDVRVFDVPASPDIQTRLHSVLHWKDDEVITFCDGDLLNINLVGQKTWWTCGRRRLYGVRFPTPSLLEVGGMPLVTQIEFTNILDWRCYTPELDGFVVRLHVLDAPTAHFSTFASASSSDSKLALLGLPCTEAGYAVRDAIISATLDLSRFASLDRSTLGRLPGETHPCL